MTNQSHRVDIETLCINHLLAVQATENGATLDGGIVGRKCYECSGGQEERCSEFLKKEDMEYMIGLYRQLTYDPEGIWR